MSSRTEPAGARLWVALLAGTVAVAAVLRLMGLGSGLWFDEIVTLVASARLPMWRILTEFPGVNAHPLYSVLAHVSMASLGESAWALRLPACVFGVASVWMAFVLGARLIGRVEALAGAAVMATSYHHIWFSQNARGYTMLGFFTLVSTYFVIRASESGERRHYVFYALACAAGVYTHLTMVFVVVGQAAALAGVRAVRGRATFEPHWMPLIWAWAGAGVLSALAYAPFGPGLVAHFGSEAPHEAAKVATGSWALAEALRSLLSGAGVPAAMLGGVAALVGAISLMRRAPQIVALLIVPAIVTAGVIAAMGQPLRPRFFFFLAGTAAIFVGRGIGAAAGLMARRSANSSGAAPVGAVVGCTLVLVAASAVALPRNYQIPKQDFEGAVRFLETQEAAGDRIVAAGPACVPLDGYYGKAAWACAKTLGELDRITAQPGRVLLVYTLADYIDDPALRDHVRSACAVQRTFPGTLGGGDLVVCDPRQRGAR